MRANFSMIARAVVYYSSPRKVIVACIVRTGIPGARQFKRVPAAVPNWNERLLSVKAAAQGVDC